MPARPDRRRPVVLASASPQRSAILTQLGIPFEVHVAEVDEETTGDPVDVARDNALRKALAVAAVRPEATVIGADTVVALDGEIFGKPPSPEAAASMLRRLAGRSHAVVSGLAIVESGMPQVVHEVTNVTFRELADELVERYVATGEWAGRAGGYAIQGRGAALVASITGDYLNVVGLPASRMLDLKSSLMLMEN